MQKHYSWCTVHIFITITSYQVARSQWQPDDKTLAAIHSTPSAGLYDNTETKQPVTKYVTIDYYGYHKKEAQLSPRDRVMREVSWNLANCHATLQKLLVQLEGKYSLESTDPRESEIRAPPQLTIALKLSYYLFIIAKLFKVKDGCLKFVYVGKKIPGLRRFWTVTSTPG